AISSGRVHLVNLLGSRPDNPRVWGWRSEDGDTSWNPLGNQIGWVSGEDVYLDAESTFAEIQRFASEQGDALALTQRQLHKRLKESNVLASSEAQRVTSRRMLQGHERTVLHIRAGVLFRLTNEVDRANAQAGAAGQAKNSPTINVDEIGF